MNDTLIFFVLAALALVFKLLTGRGTSEGDELNPPAPPAARSAPPPQRAGPQSEEERVRRFLEALGVPPGTQPPPPVRRRVVTPAPAQRPKVKRSWAQPLPPLVTTPEDFNPPPVAPPPVAPVTPPIPQVRKVAPPPAEIEIAVLPPEKSPLPAMVLQASSPARAQPTPLGALLRTRGNLQRAMMLREILGPPRGLEPLMP